MRISGVGKRRLLSKCKNLREPVIVEMEFRRCCTLSTFPNCLAVCAKGAAVCGKDASEWDVRQRVRQRVRTVRQAVRRGRCHDRQGRNLQCQEKRKSALRCRVRCGTAATSHCSTLLWIKKRFSTLEFRPSLTRWGAQFRPRTCANSF